ncbi:MAG: replication and repair protein RecO [Acidimicrobiaceae bacterium]|nr:replication and repair protein RecO [Acidimicrobiaceae bacterium]
MALYRDHGVVLRTMRLGEADRIVTVVTPEHGKVRAVAKGVRRTKSKIGARLEPLTSVSMLCWKGRELDIVTQVEVVDAFRAIREDLDRLAPAMTLLEIVDQVAVEGHPAPELYTMLVGALRALERSGSPLLVGAFSWKLLAAEGVGPVVESCARCGSPGPLVAFDAGEGGFLCKEHRRGQSVSPAAWELVRRVLGGGLAGVLAEPSAPAGQEMERLAMTALEHHIDRRLRTTRHFPDAGPGG